MFKRLLAAVFALIAATAFAAVDANKATQAELEAVKGIGPAISGKILDERKKGNFKDWKDMIDRVKGVGDGNAAKFSTEGLTVNGQAFSGAPAAAPAKAADKPVAAAAKTPADDKAMAKKADDKPMAAADAKKTKEDAKAAKASAADAKKSEKAAAAESKKADKEAKKAAKAAAAASAAAAKK